MPSHSPRFHRAPAFTPLDITDRDREIIRQVYVHRFLNSLHIHAVIGGSFQQLLRRLKLLYHHGYLERPRAQLDYYHKGGSRPMVYGVGSRGATLLNEELGNAFQPVRWGEKNRSVGRIFLEHALFVSDVMVAIELACQKKGIRLISEAKLADTAPVRKPFRWRVDINSNVKLGVVPDKVFGLEFTNEQGTAERRYFFLEADRGTMPVTRQNLVQTSFYRKLLAYEATWKQSLHVSRFGFNRFRVLTVTRSAARKNSILEACSKLESGQGIFLFADRSILETAENILSTVWTNGRGETEHLLN